MTFPTKKTLLWTATTVIAIIIVSIVVLLYIFSAGIPFVEGDVRISSGSAYGFKIGMSKQEVFSAIRSLYNKKNYSLRVLWLKDSKVHEILSPFENTNWAKYPKRKYSEYKELTKKIKKINPPLEHGKRWDIDMPASWVNSIYLTFENGMLVEIQKSKWLFERP